MFFCKKKFFRALSSLKITIKNNCFYFENCLIDLNFFDEIINSRFFKRFFVILLFVMIICCLKTCCIKFINFNSYVVF